MKKIKLLVTVAAISVAIAPKIIGLYIIENLNSRVAQINQIPSYRAKVKEVNSGWFTSSAVIELSLSLPEMDAELQNAFTFQLNFNAQHGPILLGDQPGIGREAWSISYRGEQLRKHLDYAADQAFYTYNAKTNLFGITSINDKIQPFSAQTTENNAPVNIQFSGYTGAGDIKGEQISYAGKVDKVSFAGSGKLATIENIQVDSHLNASIEQIFSGDMYDSLSKVSINSINLDDTENSALKSTIKNTVINVESVTEKANKLFHILSSYAVESYDVMGSVGQNLLLNLDLKNLSSDFFKAYQAQMQEVAQSPQSDPVAVQQQLLEFINNNVLDLLIASPEMNMAQLSGTIDTGKFNAQLLTKIVNVTALPDNLLDNGFWLSHLQASTHIEMDKNVAELLAVQIVKSQLKSNPQMADASAEQIDEIALQQAPIMIDNLIQQGLLQVTATGIKLVAELKDSQAILNGNPVPLPL